MKISPHRRIRKYLNFYKSNFEFKTPYEIVVDETFCLEALTCLLNFKEQVPKYLEDESSKISTTICVIKAAKKLGPKGADVRKLVKELEVRPCDHGGEPVTSSECLFSSVKKNNPHRLFVATQDNELVNKCRSVASVPMLYVLHNRVCLENPEGPRTHEVKRKATEDASNPKKKKKPKTGEQNQSPNSIPIKNIIDACQQNEADKQYPKKVSGENQGPDREPKLHPFQLQKPAFNRRKSNFGRQKKFGGHKGKNFTKQNNDACQQNEADTQYPKKVSGENQRLGREPRLHPFQLQKPAFNPRKSNFGRQKKFGGHKGKNFTKQFKKKPFVKKY